MLAAGISVIQYREKDKSMREMYEECLLIRRLTNSAGALFIVNDHIDLALMVNADGVHIGQDDLPADKVRALIGDRRLIGLSTHSPAQAVDAAQAGAVDYIGVGPIFPTNTKKDVCRPVGLEYLHFAAQNIKLPFVAIGGIKEYNIAQVKKAGARTVALVSEIVGAENIVAKVQALKTVMVKNTGA